MYVTRRDLCGAGLFWGLTMKQIKTMSATKFGFNLQNETPFLLGIWKMVVAELVNTEYKHLLMTTT